MNIIIFFVILEVIVVLMGYFIFQKGDSLNWTTLNKGPNETLPHFWVFYHLKICAIIIILAFINTIFGRHSKIGYILKKAIDK